MKIFTRRDFMKSSIAAGLGYNACQSVFPRARGPITLFALLGRG